MNVDHFRFHELPRHSGCPEHPDEIVTGVCASCLRERLSFFDPETRRMKPSSSSEVASVAASLKAGIFRGSRAAVAGIAPELRRTRSFSARGRSECSTSGHFEPQRKSCDVRVRNTLWSLFHLDDENAIVKRDSRPDRSSTAAEGVPGIVRTVLESREEEEKRKMEEARIPEKEILGGEEEIRISMERDGVNECFQEERTMKAHIDLDSRVSTETKKQPSERGKDSAGGFWFASIFTKRIHKWRRKQSKKAAATTLAPSEITETARRSCDTEPRFSIDAGRNSWDLPRFSLDEPRASWDGYLIGKAFSRPSFSGVDEAIGTVDNLIPVQEDTVIPGGSAHTKDYYSDSSSSQRGLKGLWHSQKMTGEEMPTLNCNATSRVSMAPSDEFQGSANDYSLRDDFSGSFGEIDGDSKRMRKSRRWSIWGFIHWRGKEDDRDCRCNGIERSFSEWKERRRNANGGQFGGIGPRDFRYSSSMSSRSFRSRSSFGDCQSNGMEMNGSSAFLKASSQKIKKKKKRDEPVLDRNRSARYSPSHFDNGLLRFYLTPLRSSSSKNGSMVNGRVKSAHSFARSVLRLY